MSWPRLVRRLLSWYPAPWRARYGEEMNALVDDLLDGRRQARWRLVAGLALGSLKERVGPTVTTGEAVRVASWFDPRAAGLMKHFERWPSRGLTYLPASTLRSEEAVVGCFDATTSWPTVWRRRSTTPALAIGTGTGLVIGTNASRHGDVLIDVVVLLLGGVTWYVGSLLWLRVTHSHRRTYVLTTHALLCLENGRFNRPLALHSRTPAVAPELVRSSTFFREVRLGNDLVWVHRTSEPVLRWMANTASGAKKQVIVT